MVMQKLWRAGWIADYPDPENFLAMFYGGNISDQASMMNRFKFQSSAYDTAYENCASGIRSGKTYCIVVKV